MKIKKRLLRRTAKGRKGAAVVEFAVCAPVLMLLGFGLTNAGLLVQMRHNSKLIGHLAATELFKQTPRDAVSAANLEAKFEQMAAGLGIEGFDISITESNEIAVVTTTMPVAANSTIPPIFQTAENVVTETHVFAPFN